MFSSYTMGQYVFHVCDIIIFGETLSVCETIRGGFLAVPVELFPDPR